MKVKALIKILKTLNPEDDFRFELSENGESFVSGEFVYLDEIRHSHSVIRHDDQEKELANPLLFKEPVKLILI